MEDNSNCLLYHNCNHRYCDSYCVRKYKVTAFCANALLSEKQREHITLVVDKGNIDLEEFKRLAEIERNILDFVNSGNNLYIYSSNCGNGKTSWSLRLLISYIDKIWVRTDLEDTPALFISVPRFLVSLKENISGNDGYAKLIKEKVKTAKLVVWDDIAAKLGSDYDIDQLFTLIKTREDEGLSNIYTSNLSPTDLKSVLGSRIQSRIANESMTINLKGADKRFLKLQEERKESN